MPGLSSTQRLPAGGSLDVGIIGSATRDANAPGAMAACEPTAEPPLLRGADGELAAAVPAPGEAVLNQSTPEPDGGEDPAEGRWTDPVQAIVTQLTPIESREALLSSFAREANPHDEFVLAAYGCVWADLAFRVARSNTRRARIQATMARARNASRASRP